MKAAFERLGGNVRQAGDLAAETARRWPDLSPELRERTGIVAPARALRDGINATIRDGLVAEGAVSSQPGALKCRRTAGQAFRNLAPLRLAPAQGRVRRVAASGIAPARPGA
ncbi:MAG: hypothetical protein F4213_22650 [Boseongicola sp. SB0677_bin_26]|nr:hypothetical protein [Boseongicola sp. SB0677_bin_26]